MESLDGYSRLRAQHRQRLEVQKCVASGQAEHLLVPGSVWVSQQVPLLPPESLPMLPEWDRYNHRVPRGHIQCGQCCTGQPGKTRRRGTTFCPGHCPRPSGLVFRANWSQNLWGWVRWFSPVPGTIYCVPTVRQALQWVICVCRIINYFQRPSEEGVISPFDSCGN